MRVRSIGLGVSLAATILLPTVAAAAGGGFVAPAGTVLPDIVEAVPDHLAIHNQQQREMLRFTTVHINIGEGNLQIRGGGQIAECTIDGIDYAQCTLASQEFLDRSGRVLGSRPAGAALFHPEHNHWHQGSVALFDLRTELLKPETALENGVKITFCFVDVETISQTGAEKKQFPRTYFECNGELQGLAARWGDSYHQSTPLQELDITDVPDGDYYLTHTADPNGNWVESNEKNNFSWVQIRLSQQGGNRKVTVLDHSPCVPEAICGFGGNP
jgi:Lysyl oxidase